jgi:hypothetical protein
MENQKGIFDLACEAHDSCRARCHRDTRHYRDTKLFTFDEVCEAVPLKEEELRAINAKGLFRPALIEVEGQLMGFYTDWDVMALRFAMEWTTNPFLLAIIGENGTVVEHAYWAYCKLCDEIWEGIDPPPCTKRILTLDELIEETGLDREFIGTVQGFGCCRPQVICVNEREYEFFSECEYWVLMEINTRVCKGTDIEDAVYAVQGNIDFDWLSRGPAPKWDFIE